MKIFLILIVTMFVSKFSFVSASLASSPVLGIAEVGSNLVLIRVAHCVVVLHNDTYFHHSNVVAVAFTAGFLFGLTVASISG